jgi:hypothetical protein
MVYYFQPLLYWVSPLHVYSKFFRPYLCFFTEVEKHTMNSYQIGAEYSLLWLKTTQHHLVPRLWTYVDLPSLIESSLHGAL